MEESQTLNSKLYWNTCFDSSWGSVTATAGQNDPVNMDSCGAFVGPVLCFPSLLFFSDFNERGGQDRLGDTPIYVQHHKGCLMKPQRCK